MRMLPIVLALCATSAFAQLGAPNRGPAAFQSTWTLGAQTYGPSLSGHVLGTQDGKAFLLDLEGDLGLGKDKARPGLFFDYEGPSFAFQVTTGSADYRGDRTLARQITLNGQTFAASTRVQSHMKLASLDGIWTIKFAQEEGAWLGFDVGAQVWTLDLDGTSVPTAPATATAAASQVKATIPQVGLSGGSRGYNGAVETKAYLHYLTYKHATYTLYGVDVRVFPVRWFGLRAFYEAGTLKVPQGSLKDDLDLRLDRKGMGFGAVVRF